MKKFQSIVLVVLMSLLLAACPPEETPDGIAVAFTDLTQDGSQTVITTRLTLIFDKDITGLTAEDIAFDAGSTGAVKGTLTRAGAGYRLNVSGITETGTVSVGVSKSGYTITPNERQTTVYFPNTYTVSFDVDGGLPQHENLTVIHGSTLKRPLGPQKTGVIFYDWYQDEAFTTLWNFIEDTVTDNITLYARYINASELDDRSAFDFFQTEGISIGWNLGNSLDSPREETGWGNPVINQAIMNGVKDAGFNIIRIPVTWGYNIGPAPDYTINETYMERVAEVIDYAKEAGFKAAIINIHHDGNQRETDPFWLSINEARGSDAGYENVTGKFTAVWRQIADYFRDYDTFLMFESFNEIHDGGWGWNMQEPAARQFEIIDSWNQIFTDIVRQNGSYNAVRFLVIAGYYKRVHRYTEEFFTLPEDSAPGKQIVSFHYYNPEAFSLRGTQRGQGANAYWWGTEDDLALPANEFMLFKERFINNKIPVIIGEMGPVQSRNVAGDPYRRDFVSHVYKQAKDYGLVPVYWDNGRFDREGDGFGLFNRTTGQPQTEEFGAVIRAMVEAVN